MRQRAIVLICLVSVLNMVSSASAGLIGYRPLDEGAGDRKNPAKGGAGPIYIDDIYLTKP